MTDIEPYADWQLWKPDYVKLLQDSEAEVERLRAERLKLENELAYRRQQGDEYLKAEVERLREVCKVLWNTTQAYNMGASHFCEIKEDNPWIEDGW